MEVCGGALAAASSRMPIASALGILLLNKFWHQRSVQTFEYSFGIALIFLLNFASVEFSPFFYIHHLYKLGRKWFSFVFIALFATLVTL